jgi:Sulfotransferase family
VSFVVEEVSLHAARDERLAGFELERPREGEQSELHALRVQGWAAGRDRPVHAVEVVYHGRPLQSAPIISPPPNTGADRPPGAWETLVGLLGLRADAELELHVVFDDGERVPAATLRLRRAPLRSGFEPQLQPLILSSLGRSGSTWLMKVFASHPEIVVMRHFPYESSPAKYWMHALKVLSDPANLAQSVHPNNFHADRGWAGNNPYFNAMAIDDPERAAWLAGAHFERLARFFQETAEQWYLAVAGSQGQQAPRYFAEKHLWPNFLPVLIRELYPGAREVFLVRDFRDVACSALLAEDRHQHAPFGSGRQAGMSEEEYVQDVVRRMATDMRRSWETRGPGAHLVRYEDMAHRPHDTLTSLLSYLGVDSSAETVERVVELASHDVPDLPKTTFEPARVEAHRVGRSPQSSIGRWRERDDAFRAVLDDALGDALTAFGYDREDDEASARAAAPAPAQPAVD